MRSVILQPTFIPWVGFFDLMEQVDCFIFLDSVQFNKRSWQQRNRIKTNQGLKWLTIPINVKGLRNQNIADTTMTEPDIFKIKFLKMLEQYYSKSTFFNDYFPDFSNKIESVSNQNNLSFFNISIIKWCAKILGINSKFLQSSHLNINGNRSELLINICNKIESKDYLSPLGSKDYLKQDESLFLKHNIKVTLHQYDHPIYNQMYPPFLPYASVIDLIFNEGPKSKKIILSGRKPGLIL